MTREEAIKTWLPIISMGIDNMPELKEAFDMAIKALEQEPKTGHWIDTNNHQYYNDGYIETTELRCSCCRETVEWDIELPHKPYFCENCGADLREEQTGENAEQGKEKNK